MNRLRVDRERRAERDADRGDLPGEPLPQQLVLLPVAPEVGLRQVGVAAEALDVLDHGQVRDA